MRTHAIRERSELAVARSALLVIDRAAGASMALDATPRLVMRAIAIAKPGGPEVLVEVERPAPEPSRGARSSGIAELDGEGCGFGRGHGSPMVASLFIFPRLRARLLVCRATYS